MKIAMFTDAFFPRVNGVAVSVKSYAAELSKAGNDVLVVCLEYTQEQSQFSFLEKPFFDAAFPFKVLRIPSAPVIFSKEDRMVRLDTWRFLKKNLDLFMPDVIHINSEWSVGYLGSIYARHRHIPFVFTFHTMWEDYLANYVNFLPNISLKKIGAGIVKYYLKRSDLIIAPTQKIAEVVQEYGIDKKPVILPTGIPQEKTAFDEEKNKLVTEKLFKMFPSLQDRKILLYTGRIVKEKNLSFLLDVLSQVKKEDSSACLLLVGNGPYLEELKDLALSKGLSQDVFFTGYVNEDVLVYLYRISRVFVFPSKTDTQGLVTIEAMLNGLPVVAVGALGTIDVMQGNHGGYMTDDNVKIFSKKVLKLLGNEKLWNKKSAEALEWGRKWKISELTPKLIQCYRKAIDNKIKG
jgi:glycosyltransferase involved in cell wall biosynthesis